MRHFVFLFRHFRVSGFVGEVECMTAMSTRKRITELSVAELRTQLGKRGVEATGDRPSLIAKLKKVCPVAIHTVGRIAFH